MDVCVEMLMCAYVATRMWTYEDVCGGMNVPMQHVWAWGCYVV